MTRIGVSPGRRRRRGSTIPLRVAGTGSVVHVPRVRSVRLIAIETPRAPRRMAPACRQEENIVYCSRGKRQRNQRDWVWGRVSFVSVRTAMSGIWWCSRSLVSSWCEDKPMVLISRMESSEERGAAVEVAGGEVGIGCAGCVGTGGWCEWWIVAGSRGDGSFGDGGWCVWVLNSGSMLSPKARWRGGELSASSGRGRVIRLVGIGCTGLG
jgi:hypothetical protein